MAVWPKRKLEELTCSNRDGLGGSNPLTATNGWVDQGSGTTGALKTLYLLWVRIPLQLPFYKNIRFY